MASSGGTRPAIIEVLVSISLGIAFFIVILVSIVFRSFKRYQSLRTRTVRFEPSHALRKGPDDDRRAAIVSSIGRSERIIENPPQFGRRLPAVLRGDARLECAAMMARLRVLLNGDGGGEAGGEGDGAANVSRRSGSTQRHKGAAANRSGSGQRHKPPHQLSVGASRRLTEQRHRARGTSPAPSATDVVGLEGCGTRTKRPQRPYRLAPTMRIGLAHLRGLYDEAEAADFLHTYEHILYGPPAEAWPEYITERDMRRMREFFAQLVTAIERADGAF